MEAQQVTDHPTHVPDWRILLNDARDRVLLADHEVAMSYPGSLKHADLIRERDKATRFYEAALDACLDGQNVLIFKLSYTS